ETRDPKENAIAAGSSRTTEALMVSSERSSRRVYPELVEGSNHEGVLTNGCCKSGHPVVRVPGEGRGPAITSILVPNSRYSLRLEQALKPALDPGLRRGHGA